MLVASGSSDSAAWACASEPQGTALELVPVECSAPAGARSDLFKLTSGTTGEPRAIRFTAAQLLADCDNVCDTMGLREDDRNYGVISFAHSYGFSNLITPLLCRGIPLVVASDVMPRALLEGLASSGATLFPGVPAIFRTLAEVGGGGKMPCACAFLQARLSQGQAPGDSLKAGGLSFTHFTAHRSVGEFATIRAMRRTFRRVMWAPRSGMCRLPWKIRGRRQIQVRGPAVGAGYHPDQGEDNLRDGVFRPSDLLEWSGEGYVIAGRTSDLINVGGRKVNPARSSGCSGSRRACATWLCSASRPRPAERKLPPVSSVKRPRTNCGGFAPVICPPGRFRGDGFSGRDSVQRAGKNQPGRTSSPAGMTGNISVRFFASG